MSSSEGINIFFKEKRSINFDGYVDPCTLKNGVLLFAARNQNDRINWSSFFFCILLLYLTLFPLYDFRYIFFFSLLGHSRFVAFIFNFLLFWIRERENSFFVVYWNDEARWHSQLDTVFTDRPLGITYNFRNSAQHTSYT